MAINTIFIADVDDNGMFKYHQHEAFYKYMKSFKPGTRVKVIIKPFKAGDRIRSIDANAYYWGCVIEILRMEWGYEKEEMHDALGLMFRRDYSKPVPTIIRTSNMSSRDFWEYIERIRRWAASEFNIVIPDPNKVDVSIGG